MKRYDIINLLIKKNNYKSYLEIGTQADVCLRQIRCAFKVGVDPKPVEHYEVNSNEFYQMYSDDFFDVNARNYDIIFIDGLHEYEQVIKDVRNSFHWLNSGGTVVLHDCNPQKYEHQLVPMPHVPTWNGNVWRAWLFFRRLDYYKMYVVDADEGCGVMQLGKQEPLTINYRNITFEQFNEKRKEYLNLISVEEFVSLLPL